ncbi:MAG TPA: response regulator [Pyrinomonadaceae bacterium]|jgi:CheY-like chemotaxis protein
MSKRDEFGRAVLVVDNNDSVRQTLAIWLEMLCCETVEAVDGEKAITLAGEEAPKLILMDMHLPVVDGFEAAKQIATLDQTSNIPIVAMSAQGAEFNWREKARRMGCVECVSKPLDFETVSDIVNRYIPQD